MYNLNINKSSIVPTNLIVGRVLDKPFDTIQFKIHDGLDVMDLTGCTLEFRGTTPDNKKVTSNAIKILDAKSGEIEFTFPPNFYSAKGHFQNAYFVIKKGTNSESTNDLLITVLNAVDFNLDDAPIIIDQLDDLIQAVIDDLNNQLSKVKGDIKQTQDNITTLKKDVDAYKGQFNTEISKMQKQLDDLAKAINQTDIQRPQITSSTGKQLYYFESSKTFHEMVIENIKTPGYFKVQTFSTKGQPEQYINGMINVQIVNDNPLYYSYYFIGVAVGSGKMYSYSFHSQKDIGWSNVDGQVIPITSKTGGHLTILNDATKNLGQLIRTQIQEPSGYFKLIARTSKGQPVSELKGMAYKENNEIFFTGSNINGDTYSYISARDGVEFGWTDLRGQVAKITGDDGRQFDMNDRNKTMLEFAKILGAGTKKVYIHNAVGIPEQFLHGLMNIASDFSVITFEGSAVISGNPYSFALLSGVEKGWKRLDGQVKKITQDDGSGHRVDGSVIESIAKMGKGLYMIYFDTTAKDLPFSGVGNGIAMINSTDSTKILNGSIYVTMLTGDRGYYANMYVGGIPQGWKKLG